MTLDELRVVPAPGDAGLLARLPGVVLFVADASAAPETTSELLRLCHDTAAAAAPTPGRTLARRVAGLLSAADPEAVPAFCVLGQAESGVAAVVHGDVDLTVRDPSGETALSGRAVATWVDRLLDDVVTATAGPPGVGRARGQDHLNLTAGVVPAGGFTIGPMAGVPPVATSAPVPPPPPESSPLPAPTDTDGEPTRVSPRVEAPSSSGPTLVRRAEDFESVLLDEPDPQAAPAPLPVAGTAAAPTREPEADGDQVHGVHCSRGHFNDPRGLYCSACGISMVQNTKAPVRGPRPPLGLLVFDDGRTYSLDADYVVGRTPEDDDDVATGRARPLALDDVHRSVSRVHAEIRLEEWDVIVSDRRSTNGTFIWDPVANRWNQLVPDQPVRVDPGARLAFGRGTCFFDSPHHHRLT